MAEGMKMGQGVAKELDAFAWRNERLARHPWRSGKSSAEPSRSAAELADAQARHATSRLPALGHP
jgi:hypothetical protein